MRKNVIFCFWVAVLWGVCWASAEVLLLLLRRMAFGSKYTRCTKGQQVFSSAGAGAAAVPVTAAPALWHCCWAELT